MAMGHEENEENEREIPQTQDADGADAEPAGSSEPAEGGEAAEEISSPEEESKYAFPEAAVVRVMKRYLDKEKMVKKEVKIAMNQWLEKAAMNIAKEMNKVPYVMVTLNEFRQGVKMYDSLEEFDMEKQRILAHMEAIKKDIERLERDLGKLVFNPDGVRN